MSGVLDRVIVELEGLSSHAMVEFFLQTFKADDRVTKEALERRILHNFDKNQFFGDLRARSVSGLAMPQLIFSVLFPEDRPKRTVTSALEAARQQYILQCIQNDVEIGLEVREVELDGRRQRGVFTTKSFYKGEFVCEYAGRLMKAKDVHKLPDRGDNNYTFYFKHKTQHGESWCINAEEETSRMGRLINHGVPNIQAHKIVDGLIPRIYFEAIEDIPAGQELLYDYNDRRKDVLLSNPWLKFSQTKANPKPSPELIPATTASPSQEVSANAQGKGKTQASSHPKESYPIELPQLNEDKFESNLESMYLKAREDVSSDRTRFTRVNLYASIGGRQYMEDIVQFQCGTFDGTVVLFGAVYDGHGGDQAAIYCRDKLVSNIKFHFKEISVDGVKDAMTEGFAATHEGMLQVQDTWRSHKGLESTAGTTATVLILFNESYVVGYVGDSSAYMISLDKNMESRCEKLTEAHSPRNRSEIENVVRAGGRIMFKNGDCRVVGGKTGLNMTRAMGNFWSLTNKRVYAISKEPAFVSGSSAQALHFILTSDGCDILPQSDICRLVDQNKYSNFISRYLVGAALARFNNKPQMNADNTSAVVISAALSILQKLYNPPSPVTSSTPSEPSVSPSVQTTSLFASSETPSPIIIDLATPEDSDKAGRSLPDRTISTSRVITSSVPTRENDTSSSDSEPPRFSDLDSAIPKNQPDDSTPKDNPPDVLTSNEEGDNAVACCSKNYGKSHSAKVKGGQVGGQKGEGVSVEHACKKRIRRGGKFLPNPGGYKAPYTVRPGGKYGRVVTREIPLRLRSRQLNPEEGKQRETETPSLARSAPAESIANESSDDDQSDSS